MPRAALSLSALGARRHAWPCQHSIDLQKLYHGVLELQEIILCVWDYPCGPAVALFSLFSFRLLHGLPVINLRRVSSLYRSRSLSLSDNPWSMLAFDCNYAVSDFKLSLLSRSSTLRTSLKRSAYSTRDPGTPIEHGPDTPETVRVMVRHQQ
jgi:hypothetical protein